MLKSRNNIRSQILWKIIKIKPFPFADIFSRFYFPGRSGQKMRQYDIQAAFFGFFFGKSHIRIFIQKFDIYYQLLMSSFFSGINETLIFLNSASAKFPKIRVPMLIKKNFVIFHNDRS